MRTYPTTTYIPVAASGSNYGYFRLEGSPYVSIQLSKPAGWANTTQIYLETSNQAKSWAAGSDQYYSGSGDNWRWSYEYSASLQFVNFTGSATAQASSQMVHLGNLNAAFGRVYIKADHSGTFRMDILRKS